MRRLRTALLVLAMPAACLFARNPQTAGGSIDGRLTDLYSRPLGGVAVVLRNVRTGGEFSTITGRNGVYRLAGLPPGTYVLEARAGRLGEGRTSGIVVMADHVARLQTAIALEGQTAAAWQAARSTWFGGPLIAPVAAEPALPVLSLAAHGVPAKNGTGMILASAAAASLRSALTMQSGTPRPIEEALLRPEPAEAALATTLGSEELQALPLPARPLGRTAGPTHIKIPVP